MSVNPGSPNDGVGRVMLAAESCQLQLNALELALIYKTLEATRMLAGTIAVAAPVVYAAQAIGQGIADIELTLGVITDEEPDRFPTRQSMISVGRPVSAGCRPTHRYQRR